MDKGIQPLDIIEMLKITKRCCESISKEPTQHRKATLCGEYLYMLQQMQEIISGLSYFKTQEEMNELIREFDLQIIMMSASARKYQTLHLIETQNIDKVIPIFKNKKPN